MDQVTKVISKIKKRDGRIVSFDDGKITTAVQKALNAVNEPDFGVAERVKELVVSSLQQKYFSPDSHPSVEEIQDLVEQKLMEIGQHKTAKAYIIYRQKRTEERELKRAMLGLNVDTKVGINQLRVLKERYLLRDSNGKIIETPEELWRRVANNIASAELLYGGSEQTVKSWSDKFYTLMDSVEFMPNTPTLMNAGTAIQQLSACFVLPIDDNIESIYETMKHQALIHQSGGGTGFSFTRIRPKGSMVKSTKGVATGPVGFMSVYNASTEIIKQGGKRRGANMGILRVDHPDIHDFIHCKDDITKINNFNISVALTEKFMQAVENNEEFDLIDPHTKQVVRKENAKALYDELVTSAWKTGDPGIVFIDRINRDNPTPQVGEIEATNPCITGDTFVSTEKGLMRMKELVEHYPQGGIRVSTDGRVPIEIAGQNGNSMLLNQNEKIGHYFISKAISSGIKEVFEIETQCGYTLTCTEDHKIFTNNGFIALKNLDINQHTILIQSGEGKFNSNNALPFVPKNHTTGENGRSYHMTLPTTWSQELGQILGWLIGDGWLRTGDKNCRVGFVFATEDEEIKQKLAPIINSYYGQSLKDVTRKGVTHLSYHSKYFVDFFQKLGVLAVDSGEKVVPETIYQATKPAVVGFLQGLFSADGTANFDAKHHIAYIRLSSRSKKLLQGTQLLLLNLGIKSNIYDRQRKERKNLFKYTTIKGQEKSYGSDGSYYELSISSDNISKFLEKVGFIGDKQKNKIEKFNTIKFRTTIFEDKIKSITSTGKKEVYDLTEPATHSMIGNGVLLHNCGEQPLLPYDSCNLGSINLAKYVSQKGEVDWERLRETIRTCVRFLDNTIDKNKYVIPQIEKMNKGNRRIGLGVMGWADLLFRMNIPYNSEEGCAFAEKMAKFIREEADQMSIEIGKEKGVFLNYKGSLYDTPSGPSFRNCARITIAPTGTISMIADCSSGIEPLFAISFVKRVMDGQELLYVNDTFKEVAVKEGIFNDELIEKIAAQGTIQHCDEVPEDIRKVFVCAHDISPYWHIRMQSAWQKYTDNGISKTVNFSHDAKIEDVAEVYMLAYKLGCKGVTIYRDGSKGFENQVLNLNVQGKSNKQVEEEYKNKVLSKPSGKDDKKLCSRCGGKNMHMQEGCVTCMDCGNSYCSV